MQTGTAVGVLWLVQPHGPPSVFSKQQQHFRRSCCCVFLWRKKCGWRMSLPWPFLFPVFWFFVLVFLYQCQVSFLLLLLPKFGLHFYISISFLSIQSFPEYGICLRMMSDYLFCIIGHLFLMVSLPDGSRKSDQKMPSNRQNACSETVPGKIFEFFAAHDDQQCFDTNVANNCCDDHSDEINAKRTCGH